MNRIASIGTLKRLLIISNQRNSKISLKVMFCPSRAVLRTCEAVRKSLYWAARCLIVSLITVWVHSKRANAAKGAGLGWSELGVNWMQSVQSHHSCSSSSRIWSEGIQHAFWGFSIVLQGAESSVGARKPFCCNWADCVEQGIKLHLWEL